MSQRAVAELIGSDAAYVSRIEAGRINITIAFAAKLAAAVRADVRELIGLCSGKPTKEPPHR